MRFFNWFKTKKNKDPKPYSYSKREIQLLDGTKVLLTILEKALADDNFEIANLNYAKLEESYRQLAEENKEKYQEAYSKCTGAYNTFRYDNLFEKPEAFIPHKEIVKTNLDSSTVILKKATAESKTNLNKAIKLIQKAIQIDNEEGYENFQAHIKLANYLFKSGETLKAIEYLKEYSSNCDKLNKSGALRHISYLYKKMKDYELALQYDCYSIYYYMMYIAPYGGFSFNEYLEKIKLSRKFNNPNLENKIDIELINFWGKNWLQKYYEKYLLIDQNNLYDIDDLIERLKFDFKEKSFEKYKDYIKKIML